MSAPVRRLGHPSDRSRRHAPYFPILQSHYLETLDTVVVAPVVRDAQRRISEVDVPIEIAGETLTVTLGELFSIDRPPLRSVRGSALAYEDALRRGLDRVFTGF